MLRKLAVFDADDVGGDPGRRAAVAGETAVGDDVVTFGHDQLVLVAQRLRQRADEVEQSRTAWRDMGTVLDVYPNSLKSWKKLLAVSDWTDSFSNMIRSCFLSEEDRKALTALARDGSSPCRETAVLPR